MLLRFRESEIPTLASRYEVPSEEIALMALRKEVQKAGFLSKLQLRSLARWKSPRSAGWIERNSDGYIKEITAFALAASDERARIEPLTLLDGVSWPTASVILHMFHEGRYPILDFRVLWSVSQDVPGQYGFELWLDYVTFTRGISERCGHDMRTVDRALWQYSKEEQP